MNIIDSSVGTRMVNKFPVFVEHGVQFLASQQYKLYVIMEIFKQYEESLFTKS
jgi:hypothetical protein